MPSASAVLYKDTEAQVVTPDGDTEFFEILVGVQQGDTLAPFLFIIALDCALREASRETHAGFILTPLTPQLSSWHVATYTTATDLADDHALISDHREEAELLSLRLEVAAETVGRHVNYSTWERNSMLYNQAEGDLVSLEGNKLKQVDNFKYLGSWIQSCEKDMNIRIGQEYT